VSRKQVIPGIQEEMLEHEGLTQDVVLWEDGLRADTGPGHFEWWYFDAHLQDGSTAVIVFMTKSLINRRSPLRPGVQVTITRPDGTKETALSFFAPNQFSASCESCDVHIADSWVRGDLHRYELHVEVDGLAADLTFTGRVPPWRPGVGKNYYTADLSRYFAWLPAIPFGDVEGTLTYDGQTHAVQGHGYHDHNWGNVDLPTVMSHWYWGRADVGDFHTIFVEQVSTKKYGSQKLPVFMLAQGNRILIGDGRPLTLQLADWQTHSCGRQYPRRLDFHWRGEEGTVHLALRRPQQIEATRLLTALPRWKQRLLGWLVNPYYFRFNAELELRIDLDDVQAVERGSALYEMMLLR
jgi:predicted secreted hydrolase